MTKPPVGTQAAAQALGVRRETLWRWWKDGKVTPVFVTPGGMPRWDLEAIVAELNQRLPIAVAIVTSQLGVLTTWRHDGKPAVGFVTGELEPGENPKDTAVREVKEEAELEVWAVGSIGQRVHPMTDRLTFYLACEPASENLTVHNGDPVENSAVRWLLLAEAEALMPTMYEPVKQYLRRTLLT